MAKIREKRPILLDFPKKICLSVCSAMSSGNRRKHRKISQKALKTSENTKKRPKTPKKVSKRPQDRKIPRRTSNDWNFFPGPLISLVRPAASARIRGLWKSR